MGHPGAPDHDHHRSVWFAHEKVSGVNFWSDNTAARVRQKEWLVYHDGDDDRIELSRDEIPAGGESRTIDLRGQDRVIRSLDLWYDAESLGGHPAVVEVYGRR